MEEVAGGWFKREVLGGGHDEGVEVGVEQEGRVIGQASDAFKPHGEVDRRVGKAIDDGDRARAEGEEATLAFVTDGLLVAAAALDGDKGMEGIDHVNARRGIEVDGAGRGCGPMDGGGIDVPGGPGVKRMEARDEHQQGNEEALWPFRPASICGNAGRHPHEEDA
jgi:hypothetical protein